MFVLAGMSTSESLASSLSVTVAKRSTEGLKGGAVFAMNLQMGVAFKHKRVTCSKNTAFYKLCAAARLPHWLPCIHMS